MATGWKQSVTPLLCKSSLLLDVDGENIVESKSFVGTAVTETILLVGAKTRYDELINETGEATNAVGNGWTGGLPSVSRVVLRI